MLRYLPTDLRQGVIHGLAILVVARQRGDAGGCSGGHGGPGSRSRRQRRLLSRGLSSPGLGRACRRPYRMGGGDRPRLRRERAGGVLFQVVQGHGVGGGEALCRGRRGRMSTGGGSEGANLVVRGRGPSPRLSLGLFSR